MTGDITLQEIQKKKDEVIELSKRIWSNPEIAFQEVKACAWTIEFLEKEGFVVERNYTGLPTAFRAEWGNGKPIIGFLAEYDALSGLSQKVSTKREEVVVGGPGHGCGHNLMVGACVAAALGLKKEMTERGLEGTIVVFGCPGEEDLTGKVFMARGGAFRELDAAFSWHPAPMTNPSMGTMAALNSAQFHFHGTSSHAGASPWEGRSALDAAELMNVGANFLREHIPDVTRIHYAFTEVQRAPNVVHDRTSVWYFVRALSRESVIETYNRLVKVAKGAALMTETEVEVEFLGGCYETLQNRVLMDTVHETMEELPPLEWTDEEKTFAAELNKSSSNYEPLLKKGVIKEGEQLDGGVAPIAYTDSFGSNDVSEVQHLVPCVYVMTTGFNIGTSFHTWQAAACAGHSIGMKGMLFGASTLAVAALKAIENPEIIAKAKAEFEKSMAGKEYICPIPDDISLPPAPENHGTA